MLCDLEETASLLWVPRSSQLEVREGQQGHCLEKRNHTNPASLLRKRQWRMSIWKGPGLRNSISGPGSLQEPLYPQGGNEAEPDESLTPGGGHPCEAASGVLFAFSLRRRICCRSYL